MARVIIKYFCLYGTAVGCGGFKAEAMNDDFCFGLRQRIWIARQRVRSEGGEGGAITFDGVAGG